MLILHPVEKEDVCIYTVAKTVQDIALIIQKHGTQYTPILKRLKVEMEQLNEVEALLAYAEEVVDNYSPNGTEKGVTKGGTKGVTAALCSTCRKHSRWRIIYISTKIYTTFVGAHPRP